MTTLKERPAKGLLELFAQVRDLVLLLVLTLALASAILGFRGSGCRGLKFGVGSLGFKGFVLGLGVLGFRV